MKTLAVYHLKGGVGKTAAAVNLAYLAAQARVPTLLWDLDPQGAASWYLRAPAQDDTLKLKKVVHGETPVGRLVRTTPFPGLDMIPAAFSYRYLDILLKKVEPPREALARLLRPFGEQYALAVLDCPPSLSHLADNVFTAADRILAPVVPTFLSLRALERVQGYLKEEKLGERKLRPFYSMADRRRSLHRALIDAPPSAMHQAFRAIVPYAAAVERMGEHGAPLPVFARAEHPAVQAYQQLWDELRADLRL